MMETVIEQKVIAAASLIIRELDSNDKLSHKAKKILSDLHTKLSSTWKIYEEEEEEEEEKEVSDIEKQIDLIKNKTMIWTYDPDEAKEYLKEVEGLRRLVESLESLNPSKDSEKHRILTKANDVLRTSIVRIEGLFKRTLVHNRYNFVPTPVRFQSCKDDAVDDGVDPSSLDLFVDDSDDDSISKREDVYIMHLIDSEEIAYLKSIADLMFDTGYDKDCVDSFISVRKDALDDLLFFLQIEKWGVQDVLNTELLELSSKIKRWGKAMRIFVRIYLPSEKLLCEQIFGQGESVSALYFSESSEASILQFLNFAEAFADAFADAFPDGDHGVDHLFVILDMHYALASLTPDIESSYPDENGLYLRTKFRDVLNRLEDYASAGLRFYEIMLLVKPETSNVASPKGEIHHLTLYLMNDITTLAAYGNSLNTIFMKHRERDDQDSTIEDDNFNEMSSLSPMGLRFRSLMSALESNLERLYKEDAMRHLFLMNNVHYMTKKVKGSKKLITILGGDWVREHDWKFQRHAMSYEISTWSPILKLFTDEGLNHSASSSLVSKTLLKERLKVFYTAFKGIYKSQTGWLIPDDQLRQDMRISISHIVIQAYRTFISRHANNINEKYIKYSADELENYLLDLFEGFTKSL